VTAYVRWRELRRSEEIEGADKRAERNQIMERFTTVAPAVKRKSGRIPEEKPIATTRPTDALTELIEMLQSFAASKTEESGHTVAGLISAWQRLKSGDDVHEPNDNQCASAWRSLIRKPGSTRLFQLRERAAVQVLDTISGSLKATPQPPEMRLEARLRTRIEEALRGSQFDVAERLLVLDDTSGTLSPSEHDSFRFAVFQLRTAQACEKAGEHAKARQACLTIIASTGSLEVGEIAAELLKRIPRR
jgi:hypothetical protein